MQKISNKCAFELKYDKGKVLFQKKKNTGRKSVVMLLKIFGFSQNKS